jgi:hypothetical protein
MDRIDTEMHRPLRRCAYCDSGLYAAAPRYCPNCKRIVEDRDNVRPMAPIEYSYCGYVVDVR